MKKHEMINEQYKNEENLKNRIQIYDYSVNKYNWFNWLFDNMSFEENSNILELGCGTGAFWHKNKDKIGLNWTVRLSDFSEGMLQDAKRNLGELSQKFEFSVINAESIPFQSNSFDVVIANHMLHHVSDIDKALAEIHRVLKSGGRFYASTLGEKHLEEVKDLVNEFDKSIQFSFARLAGKFGLENGEKILSDHFEKVTKILYDDHLKLPNPEPLIKYVLSRGNIKTVLVGEKLEQFKKFVNSKFDNKVFNINKSVGMFIAVK